MTDKERDLELEVEKLKVFMERLSNSFIEIKEILKTKANKSDLENKQDKIDFTYIKAPFVVYGMNDGTNIMEKALEINEEGRIKTFGKEIAVKQFTNNNQDYFNLKK